MKDKFKNKFKLHEVPLTLPANHKYWEKKAVELLNEYEVIDHLIQKASQCVNLGDFKADADIQNAYLRYKILFQNVNTESLNSNDIVDRRRYLAAVKLKNLNRHAEKSANSDHHSSLDSVEGEELKTAVKYLEMNLVEVCKNPETASRDKWIESDIQEWMSAIRQGNFPQDHSQTHVLSIITKCLAEIHSPLIIFYAAIVGFLVGVGSEKKEGDSTEFCRSLKRFDQLKEEKLKRKIRISKFARVREWLGSKGGIKKLIKSYKGKPLNHDNLCRCYGEIMLPNTGRQRQGRIAILRLGTKDCPKTEEGRSVEAHFAFRQNGEKQARSLEGRKFATKKVYFYLSFSLENGFEARDVELAE